MDPDQILIKYSASKGEQNHAHQGYLLPIDALPHRRYKQAMTQLAELHLRKVKHGRGGGILVIGKSGAGKSTVLKNYAALCPRALLTDRSIIPVLLVTVPSSPTARSLAGAILEATGQSKARRGSTAEITAVIVNIFMKCDVQMLLLDEFQHIVNAQTLNAFRDVTDWLKNLMEETQVGLVACGLEAGRMVVQSNEQLARRFSEQVRIDPFKLEDQEDFLEFRGILKAFGEALPIKAEPPLYEANLSRRILYASYGLIANTVKLLEGAVSVAAILGEEEISLEVLEAAFRNRIWSEVPDRLNPFHPEASLRALDRPGEVFYLHTRSELVGSPVARKMSLNMSRGPN